MSAIPGLQQVGSAGLSSASRGRQQTALELLTRRAGLGALTLPVGCPVLDKLLRGGFPLYSVTEISGEAGCGKTQFCLLLSLQCTLPESLGGLDGSVCYLSCGEGKFPVSRLSQLAGAYQQTHGLNCVMLLSRVLIEECYNSDDTLENIRKRVPQLCQSNNVRLIIIDSIAGLFRTEFDATKADERFERTRAYFRIATELKLLADTFRLCIIVVNQVTAAGFDAPDSLMSFGAADPYRKVDPVPALGLGWAHCVNTRIILRRDSQGFLSIGHESNSVDFAAIPPVAAVAVAGDANFANNPRSSDEENGINGSLGEAQSRTRRRFIIDFSPTCPPGQCDYIITTAGVKGVPGTSSLD